MRLSFKNLRLFTNHKDIGLTYFIFAAFSGMLGTALYLSLNSSVSHVTELSICYLALLAINSILYYFLLATTLNLSLLTPLLKACRFRLIDGAQMSWSFFKKYFLYFFVI